MQHCEKEIDGSVGERSRGPNTMPVQEKAGEGMPDRRMEAKERSRAAGPELRNI